MDRLAFKVVGCELWPRMGDNNKVSLNPSLSLVLKCQFLIFLFLFFPAHMLRHAHAADESLNFKNGFEDGYLDSAEGVQSLCATKRCKVQDPYERGYKLGYKKGIQEKSLSGNLSTDPLIDSPGKTIGSDFNGDGIHDFIVGAYGNDDGAAGAGAAYIFFGASSLSGTKDLGSTNADVTILGKADSDQLGRRAVSGVGDVNGDGVKDIVISNGGPSIIAFSGYSSNILFTINIPTVAWLILIS